MTCSAGGSAVRNCRNRFPTSVRPCGSGCHCSVPKSPCCGAPPDFPVKRRKSQSCGESGFQRRKCRNFLGPAVMTQRKTALRNGMQKILPERKMSLSGRTFPESLQVRKRLKNSHSMTRWKISASADSPKTAAVQRRKISPEPTCSAYQKRL